MGGGGQREGGTLICLIFSYKCVCQIWVPIPGTCRQEPFEECVDLAKTKERQVTYPVCEDVPHQVCVDVPKEICHEIPEKKCAEKPYEKCADVPREECINVHKKIPIKVSKKIPKQRCIHTDGHQEAGPYQVLSLIVIQGLQCSLQFTLRFQLSLFPLSLLLSPPAPRCRPSCPA